MRRRVQITIGVDLTHVDGVSEAVELDEAHRDHARGLAAGRDSGDGGGSAVAERRDELLVREGVIRADLAHRDPSGKDGLVAPNDRRLAVWRHRQVELREVGGDRVGHRGGLSGGIDPTGREGPRALEVAVPPGDDHGTVSGGLRDDRIDLVAIADLE